MSQAFSSLKHIVGFALAITLPLALALVVLVLAAAPCFVKRSVRFDPADGLRMTQGITDTNETRLPWSFGAVPQRYELVTATYRIVLTTEDAEQSIGVGIQSAKAGAEDVLVEGAGIFETPGAIDNRYFVLATTATNPLVFTVRDHQGTLLGRHSLSYSTAAYSYFCSIEGP